MAKVFKFTRKDRNRFRKVYRYIRKKPVYEFCSDRELKMIAGAVDFENTEGPVTYTYPLTVTFANVPVITVTSVDSLSNDQADVNAFITSITTTEAQISVSAPFSGKVHFIIMSQD
jgi:hypothetical protein